MNNERRGQTKAIIKTLISLADQIEDVMTEHIDALEAMPEGLQYTSRQGKQMSLSADMLRSAVQSVAQGVIYLEGAVAPEKADSLTVHGAAKPQPFVCAHPARRKEPPQPQDKHIIDLVK